MEQAKLIQQFIVSVRHLGIYPDNHPIVVKSFKEICNLLFVLLKGKERISLSVSPDNKIVFNGEPVLDKSAGELQPFIPIFKRLNVEDLEFTPGISEAEVGAFVRLFVIDPQELKKYEDINRLFAEKNIIHLKAKQFSYIKVEKGKEDQVSIGQQRVEGLKTRLKTLAPPGKAVAAAETAVFERELVTAVGDELKEKKKLGLSLKNIFKKFVQQSGEQDQVLSRLKETLHSYGCRLEDVDRLIAAIREEMSRGPRARGRGTGAGGGGGGGGGAGSGSGIGGAQGAGITGGMPGGKGMGGAGGLGGGKGPGGGGAGEGAGSAGIGGQGSGLGPGFGGAGGSGAGLANGSSQATAAGSEDIERLRRENADLLAKYETLKQQTGFQDQEIKQLQVQNRRINDEKQRIDNIVHNMAEGMVVVDAEGSIVLVNSAAEQLLGITKADVGKKLKEVVKDEHLLTLTRQIVPSGTDGVMEKDIELVSPDESTKRVLRTSSAVVEDPNGATVGMVTMLNDITRQKEVEKLKEGFLAGVSHELRTPLIAVEKSISLVLGEQDAGLSPEHKQFLAIADRNLKRLTLLINDLLDLSKLEANKMELRRQPSSLITVIKESVESLGNWAKAKSISFKLELPEQLAEMEIDPNRMIQVMTNILGNAVKFSPSSGVITVRCQQLPDQKQVRVSVTDSGPGIPEADLAKIFDRFYQTSQRPSSDINGTGIGLAIVKELVELHGGRVWAENAQPNGAAFVFTLPQ